MATSRATLRGFAVAAAVAVTGFLCAGAVAQSSPPPLAPPPMPAETKTPPPPATSAPLVPLAESPPGKIAPAPSSAAPDCTTWPCGHVESIVQTTVKESWTPLGAGTYGSTGLGDNPVAVTSYEFGPGLKPGNIVILGAAGGAAYSKTPNSYQKPRWNVTVKLDTGRTRVVSMAFEPYVHEGDYVRVVGNSVELLD